MFLLIDGGELFDPAPRGRCTLLSADSRIANMGEVDRRALDALDRVDKKYQEMAD